MNAARQHTDQAHVDATPTESMIETPQTFAAKLREIGYAEPVLSPLRSSDEETESMQRYLRARGAYLREMVQGPTWRDRAGVWLANLWHKCWGGLVLIVATTFLTIGLCAVEVPDRIVAAIAAVETGTEWRNTGDVRGKWSRGADGEVSPFQLSPAALTDMGVTNHARVHRDVVYAESLARLWLVRCYAKAGNWPDAVARFNAGSRYRSRAARDYAERVLAIASAL